MKIKVYLLIFLLFLTASSFAQIQYFPTVSHDFNNDSIEDITIERGFSQSFDSSIEYCNISPQNNNVEIATKRINYQNGGSGSYVQYFEFGDTISDKIEWTKKTKTIYEKYSNEPKIWWVNKNYFIGVRVRDENNNYQYAWIRFRGNTPYKKNILRDAAIQTELNSPILAGEGITSIQPVVDKVYNEKDSTKWSDYKVVFYPPLHKSFVDEYRIFIGKSQYSNEINLDQLLTAPKTNYQKIDTGSFEYNVILNDTLLDLESKEFVLGENYTIYVLSISNNIDSFPHSLTTTNYFKTITTLPKTGNPVVLDNGDRNNSTDIQLHFTQNSKENYTKEYRILILPSDSVASFNLQKAISVPVENAHIISPKNDSIYTIENIETADIYGNSIHQNTAYNAFILSVHDGINSNQSSLSAASNNFVLSIPNYIYAGQTEGENIMYNGGEVKTSTDTCTLDFDNDGALDLIISGLDFIENNHPRINLIAHPVGNTEIIYSENELAKSLPEYFPIYSRSNWSAKSLTLYFNHTDFGVGTVYGEFKNYVDQRIGFKKTNLQDTIFGWVIVNSGRIKEYAWQKSVKSSSVQIPNAIETSFNAYPNPNKERNLKIVIKNFEEQEDYFIDVLNLSGRVQSTIKINEKLSIINLANLQRGIYYIRFRSPEKQETQKIIVL